MSADDGQRRPEVGGGDRRVHRRVRLQCHPGRARSPPPHRQSQHIDMALLDVGMPSWPTRLRVANTGTVPRRQGGSHPSLVPYLGLSPRSMGPCCWPLAATGSLPVSARPPPSAQMASDHALPQCAAGGPPQRTGAADPKPSPVRRTAARWIALLLGQGWPCGHRHLDRALVPTPGAGTAALVVRQPATGCTSHAASGSNAPSAP